MIRTGRIPLNGSRSVGPFPTKLVRNLISFDTFSEERAVTRLGRFHGAMLVSYMPLASGVWTRLKNRVDGRFTALRGFSKEISDR